MTKLSKLKLEVKDAVKNNVRSTKFISSRFELADDEFAYVVKEHSRNKNVQMICEAFLRAYNVQINAQFDEEKIDYLQESIKEKVVYDTRNIVYESNEMRPNSVKCPFDIADYVYVVAYNKVFEAYVHSIDFLEDTIRIGVWLKDYRGSECESQSYVVDRVFYNKEDIVNHLLTCSPNVSVNPLVQQSTKEIQCFFNIGDNVYRMINGEISEETIKSVYLSHIHYYCRVCTNNKDSIDFKDVFLSKEELIKSITKGL